MVAKANIRELSMFHLSHIQARLRTGYKLTKPGQDGGHPLGEAELKGRNFLTLQDLGRDETLFIFNEALRFKRERAKGLRRSVLKGKTLGLIFQKPSTRTRVSVQVAIRELGGESLYLGWSELQLARGESIADTARALSRYLHGIVARVHSHKDLEELANYSDVPVFNALSDLFHPMQTLADLFTVWEKKGRLEGLKMAWIGDGNNVCQSLLMGCAKVGLNISVASPPGYGPSPQAVELAKRDARGSGCRVEVLHDPVEAIHQADVVQTDVIASMGFEEEERKRRKAFIPRYQVNAGLLKHASPDAIVLHCQPWRVGQEITEDVAYGPQCVAFDEAENRLHTAKALFTLIL